MKNLKIKKYAMEKNFYKEFSSFFELKPDAASLSEMQRYASSLNPVKIKDGIAVISINGPVSRYMDFFTWLFGGVSYDILMPSLQKCIESDDVKTIVLDINSPGGEVDGTAEFANMIKDCSKPTFAFTGGMACSAAYWIASACDKIISSETALIGSIGVIISFLDSKKAMENAGYKEITITSRNAGMKNPDPDTPEGHKEYQRIVDDLEEIFISTVADNRGITKEDVIKNFGNGRVFVGKEALKRNMIDAVGSFESVFNSSSDEEKLYSQGGSMAKITLTMETLKEEYPELHAQVVDEGKKIERERIQGFEKLKGLDGASDLIEKHMFDGKTNANDIALSIMEKQKKTKEKILDDTRSEAEGQNGVNGISPISDDTSDQANAEAFKSRWEKHKEMTGFNLMGGEKENG